MDRTAVAFSYWHFRRQQLIFEDELVVEKDKLTSTDLMDAIKAKEKELGYLGKDLIQIADSSNPLLLSDWSKEHGMSWCHPKKMTDHGPSARAQVAHFREWLNNGKILINKKCVQLIACLKGQRWAKDASGVITDKLARTEVFGHGDILMAAVYTIRFVNANRNPIPRDHNINLSNTIMLPQESPYEVNRVLKQIDDQLDQ